MVHAVSLTRANERMHTRFGWLDSWHSFSFGEHFDPERMGFGSLRVVNDDRVAPTGGFPMHPHRDMEIVTLMLAGQLQHADSLGNGRVIEAGDIQYMSAGSGVRHSEYNPSSTDEAHFLQIWITPNAKGLPPQYADKKILRKEPNQWNLLLSPEGRENSMPIRQDVDLLSLNLEPHASVDYAPSQSNHGLWLFLISGQIQLPDQKLTLAPGDSLALPQPSSLKIVGKGAENAHLILFDLPLNPQQAQL